MLKKTASIVLASLRSSTYRMRRRRSEALAGLIHSPRSIARANGPHEVRFVPPHLFARCGLAWGKAHLGVPGLGGLRGLAFFSILLTVQTLSFKRDVH
jgi:hypothetical protein